MGRRRAGDGNLWNTGRGQMLVCKTAFCDELLFCACEGSARIHEQLSLLMSPHKTFTVLRIRSIVMMTVQPEVGVSAAGADLTARPTAYLSSERAVCEHVADQFLLSMASAAGGSFTTGNFSEHTRTNMQVIVQCGWRIFARAGNSRRAECGRV